MTATQRLCEQVCAQELLTFYFSAHVNRLMQPHCLCEQSSSHVSCAAAVVRPLEIQDVAFFSAKIDLKKNYLWIVIATSYHHCMTVSMFITVEYVIAMKKNRNIR